MIAESTSTANTLRIERRLTASPARVFAAWTNVEQVKRWAAPGPMEVAAAEVDLKVGGRYRIAMAGPDGTTHVAVGEYREVVPNARLVYTWRWESWRESHRDSIVTVEFNADGGGTTLRLTHSELPDENAVTQHTAGWEGSLAKFVPLVS